MATHREKQSQLYDELCQKKGDTLIITTRGETTSVRISPANNLKSKEIYVPLEILKEMVNAQ